MTSVTVYSAGANCPQCRVTYLALERYGIAFRVEDLAAPGNEAAREFVTSDLGYSQAPVVLVDGEPENHWSGFRPDLIERLARHQSPAAKSWPDAPTAHAARQEAPWTATSLNR